VGFEVFTANDMLQYATTYSVESQATLCLLHARFLFCLFLNPEDVGDMFLQKGA
jgi:hypothetical protein